MDIETEVRHSLKMFGLMAGQRVQRSSFVTRILELTGGDALLEVATESMLTCWQVLWDECRKLHKLLVQLVGREELCRRWCEIPGVGPVAAMTFLAAVDDPHRFARSKTLGAHFGFTPRREQSGTSIDRAGHISRRGDSEVRTALYEGKGIAWPRPDIFWRSRRAANSTSQSICRLFCDRRCGRYESTGAETTWCLTSADDGARHREAAACLAENLPDTSELAALVGEAGIATLPEDQPALFKLGERSRRVKMALNPFGPSAFLVTPPVAAGRMRSSISREGTYDAIDKWHN